MILAAGIALVTAASSPGADLETLRTAHEKSSATASRPESQRYQAALAKLETSLVSKKDYAAAIHVQRERLRVAAKIEALGSSERTVQASAGGNSSTAITLDLASATTGSGVSYDTSSGTLSGWNQEGAFAEWTLPEHPAGGYAVELTYATSATTPGDFVLSGAFYSLTRKTTPTGGETTFDTNRLQTLRLKSGTGPFRITAGKFAGDELFTLKSVKIIPQKP